MYLMNYHFPYSDNALIQNQESEQKRGQFLGSTLKSTGTTFLVHILS